MSARQALKALSVVLAKTDLGKAPILVSLKHFRCSSSIVRMGETERSSLQKLSGSLVGFFPVDSRIIPIDWLTSVGGALARIHLTDLRT